MLKQLLCFGIAALAFAVAAAVPPRQIAIGTAPAVTIDKNSRIVVAPDASKATRYAAAELQRMLSAVLGAELPVVNAPGEGAELIVGINSWSRAAGIDDSKLCRDAFIIRNVGNKLYILGLDDPKADLAKELKGGAWSVQRERGTLFGVYDFLERFAGVRMFFPGKIGTVIPRSASLAVPQVDLFDRPDFSTRKVSTFYDGSWYEGENPDSVLNPAKILHYYQMRFETAYIPNCHGLGRMKYLERFGKSHPEYFALMSDGRRHNDPALPHPGQLCFSSGIREEIYQDAKAYLSGLPAESRGMKHWDPSAVAPGYFNIMPQDGMYGCTCDKCKATNQEGPHYATNLIWNLTVEVANRLKKEGVPGCVTQMAYRPYRAVPEIAIPDNVMVMVAENGPWGKYNPAGQAADAAEIAAWTKKLGAKVWVWNYANKFGNRVMPGIPCPTPRAIAEYYQGLSPEIFGAYMESESDQFIFYYLNYYIFSKVCWDNRADVDALLADHYRAMFGPAAKVMQDIFERYEEIWLRKIGGRVVDTNLGPVGAPPSDYELWSAVYNEDTLNALRKQYAEAERLAAKDADALERVRFIRRTHFDGIEAGRKKYLENNNAVQAFRASAATPVQLMPLNGKRREQVGTTVSIRRADDKLIVRFECEEPEMALASAVKRENDDMELWRDNCVELFLNPSGDRRKYYHILVNSAGSIADESGNRLGASSQQDWGWNSNAAVKTGAAAKGWFAEIAIPMSALPDWNAGAVPVNFARHRVLKSTKAYEPYYVWGPFVRGFHDLENFGTLEFGGAPEAKSILFNGDFSMPWKSGRFFGKMNQEKNFFEGWIGPNQTVLKDPVSLDRATFLNGGASLRLENPAEGGLKDGVSVTQYLPELKPSTRYRLSFFVKLENVRKNSRYSGVCANLWDDKNCWFPKDNWLEGTTPWLHQSYEFTTGAKTGEKVKPYLRLCLHGATGTAWFDDVRLTELP